MNDEQLIKDLKAIEALIADLQTRHPLGSKGWEALETIDDLIFIQLEELR